MPNREYNAKYNDHERNSNVAASVGSSKKASYKEKARKLPSMGPKRPSYESSAPKVKTYVAGNY